MSKDEVELLYRVFDTNKVGGEEGYGAAWGWRKSRTEERRGGLNALLRVRIHTVRSTVPLFQAQDGFLELSELVRVQEHVDDGACTQTRTREAACCPLTWILLNRLLWFIVIVWNGGLGVLQGGLARQLGCMELASPQQAGTHAAHTPLPALRPAALACPPAEFASTHF